MKTKLLAPVLTLTLFVTVAAWSMQPSTVAGEATGDPTVTGRVTAVGAAGRRLTIEMNGRATELGAVSAGDRVQILRADTAAMDAAPPLEPGPSRRLLGVWLLVATGTVLVLRARRRQTL